MALRTIEDWSNWLSFLPVNAEVVASYATSLVDGGMTEDDLSELSHDLLMEMNITKPGHRTKILKNAKRIESASSSSSTKVIKCDIKLPNITMQSSPSKFRKFLIDWKIYKSEHQLDGPKCNKLLYSACDTALQTSIINGLADFLETSEENLIAYIKNAATQQSNPTVYRLEFQKLDQLEGQSVDQYIDILRDKSVDCEFICPSQTCNFDYSEFAIRDRLIQGILNKKLQTNILTNISTLPKLSDVLKYAKSVETANIGVSSMAEEKIDPLAEEAGIYAARSSRYKKASRMRNNNRQRLFEPIDNIKSYHCIIKVLNKQEYAQHIYYTQHT